jgi:hypothetical protein
VTARAAPLPNGFQIVLDPGIRQLSDDLWRGHRRRLAVARTPAVGWARRRSALDPIRYTVAGLADDIACGAGVWAGCLAHRTAAPLCPVVTWRQRRIDSPESENGHG